MNANLITMDHLPIDQPLQVRQIKSTGIIRRRLLDLGLINETVVKALQKSPAGDPTAYQIRGAVIALRADDASKIVVELFDESRWNDGSDHSIGRQPQYR